MPYHGVYFLGGSPVPVGGRPFIIMKLLYCTRCGDIVKLRYQERKCVCGESSGNYKPDGIRAVILGKGMCIGINNSQFHSAAVDMKFCKGLTEQMAKDLGDFKAWVFYPAYAYNIEFKKE